MSLPLVTSIDTVAPNCWEAMTVKSKLIQILYSSKQDRLEARYNSLGDRKVILTIPKVRNKLKLPTNQSIGELSFSDMLCLTKLKLNHSSWSERQNGSSS